MLLILMPDRNYSRIVYTTETGRVCPNCGQPVADCRCKKQGARPKGDGVVRVFLDRKGRKGGVVSLISGLPGSAEELKALATELKRRCGTGGTVKDGNIEIQGDHRDVLVEVLKARGLNVKKAGG
jgi:translation initiation factor 1